MKRTAQIALLAAMAFTAGCGTEFYANRMMNVDTSRGRFDLAVAGSPDRLIETGKITSYHQPRIGNQQLELWLISASSGITARTGGVSLGTVLLVHDIHRSKASMLSLGGKLAEMGFDVVLPDLRAHGASQGEAFTYGAYEKRDLKVVMDALLRQGSIDDKIVVYGEGLGASVAVGYAAIDPNCSGVVAYQPYADIAGVLRQDGTFKFLSERDLADVIALGADMGKFDPRQASATEAAARLACPLLVIRRRGDFGYPVEQAHAVYDRAGGAKEFFEIPMSDDWAYKTATASYLADVINAFANGGLVTGHYRAITSDQAAPPTTPAAPQPVQPREGEGPPIPSGGNGAIPTPTVIHRTRLR